MSTRISRVSAHTGAASPPGANTIDPCVASSSSNLVVSSEIAEVTLLRAIAAEMRAALTYTTMAQLAYDMGQVERGDQAFYRAQQAVKSVRQASARLSEAGLNLVCTPLEALVPIFEACQQQRSDFHATSRQPSLS